MFTVYEVSNVAFPKSKVQIFLARPSSCFAYTLQNIILGNVAKFLIDLSPKITT